MLRPLLLRTFLAIAVLAPMSHTALAKKPDKGQKGEKGDKRAKIRERIREYRNARLTEALGLDDATATKLFAVVAKYDDLIMPLREQLGQARRELKQLIDAGSTDDARMTTLVDIILKARADIESYEHQRAADVRKILSARQFAKLVVVWPEIDRQIEQEIRKAAKKRLGGGGPADDDLPE